MCQKDARTRNRGCCQSEAREASTFTRCGEWRRTNLREQTNFHSKRRYNWRERILKEIASAVGTPIDIDGPTRNRTFGHYARILVDIDPSKITFDEILVERDGFAFKFEVQYERRPLFCHHYFSIGNDVSACRWLRPQPPKDKNGRGKQIIVAEAALPPKPTWQNNNNNDVVAYVGTKCV
ncbi:hypothetical protein MTR_4g031470 [Medicago truncatula]|uniref:DUF4283 domain protein n=1 Tax=Medicago truncatula TaxID=3880 RepID=G7JM00_MEDTR|nr:hypothetical protein MTR_4g031470 [Medicago truncatula]